MISVAVAAILVSLSFIPPVDDRASLTVAGSRRVSAWSAGRPAPFAGTPFFNDGEKAVAEAPRRRSITLNAWEWRHIPAIKRANPNVLVLVYKDLSSTRNGDPCSSSQDDLPTGVDYCFADTHHPEWFLTDSSGKRLEYEGFPKSWQMDVGDVGYQKEWIKNVRAGLVDRGWDGVFLDNALVRADDYHPGVVSRTYPTNESLQDAYKRFLTKLGTDIEHFTIANAASARLFPGLWNLYIAPLDGGFDEHFVNWSESPNSRYAWDWGPDGWMAQIEQITDAEAMGKVAAVRAGLLEPTADTEGFKYGLGSYLLANGGHSLFAFGERETWHPAYEWDLGEARGSYYAVQKSVYRRDFSAGVVIVNATEATAATIVLQDEYFDENSNVVTSVTLGPQRAAILRKR